MRERSYVRVAFGGLCTTLFLLPHAVAAQQLTADSVATADSLGTAASNPLSVSNFWALLEQAGGLRWPIYATMVVGLFLIAMKLFELLSDRRESRALEQYDVRGQSLREIVLMISSQRESMLARLESTLLNVFQTSGSHATLHDEISNFIQSQQDRFLSFRRRIDFLSDTAGALGLLGTVWGILLVFLGDTSNKQTILIGMGVALLTTLLGLVVSITLNLSTTEMNSFFDKRLESITAKADMLRFRLMEVAATNGVSVDSSAAHKEASVSEMPRSSPVRSNDHATTRRPAAKPAPVLEHETVRVVPEPEPEPEPEPAEVLSLVRLDRTYESTVGELAGPIRLKVQNTGGRAVSDAVLKVDVREGEATIDGEGPAARLVTAADGTATFNLRLGKSAGRQTVFVSIPGDIEAESLTISVDAKPGPVSSVRLVGNNQGAPAGTPLRNPLLVRLADSFGNPVPNANVEFKVEAGGGVFKGGDPNAVVRSDAAGEAKVHYILGKDPGVNLVSARAEGASDAATFQALSMEA